MARGPSRYKFHIDLDACAYVGGVLQELQRWQKNTKSAKSTTKNIFIINTESMEADLNKVSKALKWGVTFNTGSSVHRGHNVSGKPSMDTIPSDTYNKLRKHLEWSGELDLHRRLHASFDYIWGLQENNGYSSLNLIGKWSRL